VSVRWRPSSAHSRKRRTSDKSLTQSFDVLRSSKWRLSSWTFSFCGRRCFSEVSHPHQYCIATRDTVIPMNIEVPTKYPLSHNARIESESPMLYRPALHGNWNALSLARRALKDKFPTPTIPFTAVWPNRQVFLSDLYIKWTKNARPGLLDSKQDAARLNSDCPIRWKIPGVVRINYLISLLYSLLQALDVNDFCSINSRLQMSSDINV